MSHENSSERAEVVANTVSLATMYLQTLELRMEPEQFRALSDALHGFWSAIDGEGRTSFDLDESVFTDEMHREFLVVMAILSTGHLNHRVVEMPGPDGTVGLAVVDADVADDPARLRDLREKLRRMADSGHLE